MQHRTQPLRASSQFEHSSGDLPEELEFCQPLSVGMFDGIGALRVALGPLRAPVAGHIPIEKSEEARRVVEANFLDSEFIDEVESVMEETVRGWALKYSTVSLVIIGAGPPCQGVSGLNVDRKGALRDHRSRLFKLARGSVLQKASHLPKSTFCFSCGRGNSVSPDIRFSL